jgi:hypothetical protein
MADFYSNINEPKAAVHYEKFFGLERKDRDLCKVLGDYYYKNNETEKAVIHYTQFIADKGVDEGVEKFLANYYMDKKKPSAAKFYYNLSLNRSKTFFEEKDPESKAANLKKHKLK